MDDKIETTFAIAQSYVSARFVADTARNEYCKLVVENCCCRMIDVNSREAKRLIEENSMIEVLNNEYGKVYELPDNSFRKRCKKRKVLITPLMNFLTI